MQPRFRTSDTPGITTSIPGDSIIRGVPISLVGVVATGTTTSGQNAKHQPRPHSLCCSCRCSCDQSNHDTCRWLLCRWLCAAEFGSMGSRRRASAPLGRSACRSAPADGPGSTPPTSRGNWATATHLGSPLLAENRLAPRRPHQGRLRRRSAMSCAHP